MLHFEFKTQFIFRIIMVLFLLRSANSWKSGNEGLLKLQILSATRIDEVQSKKHVSITGSSNLTG